MKLDLLIYFNSNLFTQKFVYCFSPPITFYFYICIILNTVTVYSILTQLFQPLMKTSFVQPGTKLCSGGGGGGGRQKTGSNRKNMEISASGGLGRGKGPPFSLPRLPLLYLSFFFFRPRRFFPFFPQCGAWSQAKFCPVEILGKQICILYIFGQFSMTLIHDQGK